MLLIPCPHCGERRHTEFSYGGDARVPRPADPAGLTDRLWTDYLYRRRNPGGPHIEYWHHTLGCRQWLRIERDTATEQVHQVTSAEKVVPKEDA